MGPTGSVAIGADGVCSSSLHAVDVANECAGVDDEAQCFETDRGRSAGGFGHAVSNGERRFPVAFLQREVGANDSGFCGEARAAGEVARDLHRLRMSCGISRERHAEPVENLAPIGFTHPGLDRAKLADDRGGVGGRRGPHRSERFEVRRFACRLARDFPCSRIVAEVQQRVGFQRAGANAGGRGLDRAVDVEEKRIAAVSEQVSRVGEQQARFCVEAFIEFFIRRQR